MMSKYSQHKNESGVKDYHISHTDWSSFENIFFNILDLVNWSLLDLLGSINLFLQTAWKEHSN